MTKQLADAGTFDFISEEMFLAAYQEAAGRVPAAGTAGNLPRLARESRRRSLPLDTAGPGDLLYVPDMRLDLNDRDLGPGPDSWTAVLFSNRKDQSAMTGKKILLLLIGPAEDCPEWIAGGGSPRMPASAATPEVLTPAVAALASGGGSAVPGAATTAMLAQELAESSWYPPFRREALARVLLREPARAPYSTIVVGAPVWVRHQGPAAEPYDPGDPAGRTR